MGKRSVDLRTGATRIAKVSGVLPSPVVLAAAYSPQLGRYLTLDVATENDSPRIRLVAVSADGVARILGSWPYRGTYDTFALESGDGGWLTISARNGESHALAVMELRGSRFVPRAATTGTTPLVGSPRITDKGLSIIYAKQGSVTPVLVPLSGLLSGRPVAEERSEGPSFMARGF